MGELATNKMTAEVDPDDEVIHVLNTATWGMMAADGYGTTKASCAGDVMETGKAVW